MYTTLPDLNKAQEYLENGPHQNRYRKNLTKTYEKAPKKRKMRKVRGKKEGARKKALCWNGTGAGPGRWTAKRGLEEVGPAMRVGMGMRWTPSLARAALLVTLPVLIVCFFLELDTPFLCFLSVEVEDGDQVGHPVGQVMSFWTHQPVSSQPTHWI